MNGINNLNTVNQGSCELSDEQRRICESVRNGGNHAIFGEAGTGKTSLIRILVNELKSVGRRVLCVAPTGIATRNLCIEDSMTIHRAFQLPEVISDESALPNPIWIAGIDTLIIDEISMVRSDVFTAIDRILKKIRLNNLPFGGVQIIVVGDPVQMPPFTTNQTFYGYIINKYGSLYSFHTQAWTEANFSVHKLTECYRQVNDPFFYQCLQEIHSCNIPNCDLSTLNDRLIANGIPDKGEPECQLTLSKDDAFQFNHRILDSLPGEPMTFEARI